MISYSSFQPNSCVEVSQVLLHRRPREYKHDFYRPQRSWGKVIFSEACVNNSVHGGVACVVAGGTYVVLFGGACVVLFGGACMVLFGGQGGMRGFIWGACMVLFGVACVVLFGGACVVLFGGHAWFYLGGMRGFIWGGMHGFIPGGHAWFYSGGMRGFIPGGMRGFIWGGMRGFFSFFGYNEIRSMSGRYASYWNAFLSFVYSRVYTKKKGLHPFSRAFTIHVPAHRNEWTIIVMPFAQDSLH